MQKKNILQVCLSSSWGGLEMVAFEMARLLRDHNLECWTVVTVGSPLAARLKEENLPRVEISNGWGQWIRNISLLREWIQSHDIQYVVSQNLRELFWVRWALLPFPQVQLIGFSHTFVGVFKRDFYHQWLYRRVQTLIALTPRHQQNLIKRLGMPKEKIKIIPNSVSTEKFNPGKKSLELRRTWDSEDTAILIGLVGRLDKAKGQDLLLRAAALCRKKTELKFKVILIGEETKNEPGILAELKKMTEQLNLQNEVIFTGFRRDIPEIMASLDIVVMASNAETFGRVIIEAMASGTTVVATRAGGVVDLIEDGKDGILFRPKDEADLADKLGQLLVTPELRTQISSAALPKVHSFYSAEVVHEKILALFQ